MMHFLMPGGFEGLGLRAKALVWVFLLLPVLFSVFLIVLLFAGLVKPSGALFVVGILLISLVLPSRRSINLSMLSAFLASLTILLTLALLYHKLVPAVSIFLILALLMVLYVRFQFAPERGRILLVLALAAWIVLANGWKVHKYTFPGMPVDSTDTYYDADWIVQLGDVAPDTASPPLLDPTSTLASWKATSGLERPKLVILATSGGAYRAAYWTAAVLDTLQKLGHTTLPGFTRSINLITGASGGMVAGAYLTALADSTSDVFPPAIRDTVRIREWQEFCTDAADNDGSTPDCCTVDAATITGRMDRDVCISAVAGVNGKYGTELPLNRNSLDPIAQQLVQQDLPNVFWPGALHMDRGKVLERQWVSLNRSFASLLPAEAAGSRPSIILSPMLVETGQPLLISNLDLDSLRIDIVGTKENPAAGEAVEFFKLFPRTHDHFLLQTAVRMNASFPYVSPAVSLPTRPMRRVVDAGYYDNYGVNLASAYLAVPEVIDYLITNTSGVVIVQVRAFSEVDDASEGGSGLLGRAFHWLTSPISGAGSARSASMVFRNEQELRHITNLYEARLEATEPQPPLSQRPFIRTVVFENASKASMSWYLPDHELARLKAELGSAKNDAALDTLIAIWKSPIP
jgi:hypothetical protein